MKENEVRFSPIFVVLSVLFVSCLLISNLIAGKLVSLYGMTLPAAVILFPVTYIFGDVLTEIYGFKNSRLIIWAGFLSNLFAVIIYTIVILMPHPEFWQNQDAYAIVLGTTPKILLASLLGYFAGSFSNAITLSKLKVLTSGRFLWLRTISSTIVGEGIDTIIFITIAFIGTVPNNVLLQMVILQYLWKVVYEIVLTPLTYLIVAWIKRKEGIDTYDSDVNYNPFSLKV